jgi:glutathione S-transferase
MLEVEPHLVTLLQQRMFLPAEQRNERLAAAAVEALKAPLKVIEQHLRDHEYLINEDFTIGDLDVASVWVIGTMVGLDFSSAPKTAAWLTKCTSRPASERARQRP